MDEIGAARERTLAPDDRAAAKLAAAEQAVRPRPDRVPVRRGQLRRGRPAGQRPGRRAAGRRRGDRPRPGAGPAGAGGGQRPRRQGRLLGRPDGGEDHPDDRGGAARRAADLLVHRLGRRPDHRPGRPVPGPAGGRADLRQPGRAVRQGAADLLPVRAERGGRGVHPLLLRHRDHGRGQRLDVPRLAPDGGDGGGGAGHPGGDGRRADARRGLRLRGPAGRRRRRGHRAGQAVLLLPAAELAAGTAELRRQRARPGSSPPTWCRPPTRPATTSTP